MPVCATCGTPVSLPIDRLRFMDARRLCDDCILLRDHVNDGTHPAWQSAADE
jgi:hypothetical protein